MSEAEETTTATTTEPAPPVATDTTGQPELAFAETTPPPAVAAEATSVPEALPEPPPIQFETPEPPPKREAPVAAKPPPPPTDEELRYRRLHAIEALEKEASDNVRERKLNYLKSIGKDDAFKDGHVLTLAPDADPRTTEGRAKFDEFREKNPEFFRRDQASGIDAVALAANTPTSKRGTFGRKFFEETIRSVMRKK